MIESIIVAVIMSISSVVCQVLLSNKASALMQ